jgi:hypothetical protein
MKREKMIELLLTIEGVLTQGDSCTGMLLTKGLRQTLELESHSQENHDCWTKRERRYGYTISASRADPQEKSDLPTESINIFKQYGSDDV